MDSGFDRLSPGRGGQQPPGEGIDPRARPFAADALQGDMRAFDEEKELVGKLLWRGVAGGAHQLDQPFALPALVCLDHAARRMARLGELHRSVGEGAAAADRKSTRLNSSHVEISYAVFC